MTNKYTFRKLQPKPVAARIVDSTAVRVLGKAAQKLSVLWRKFSISVSEIVTEAKIEKTQEEMARVNNKLEENREFFSSIKNENPTKEDVIKYKYNSMAAVDIDNVVLEKTKKKLEEELQSLLNKNIEIASIKGMTPNLPNDTINTEDFRKELEAAGIGVNTSQEKVEEVKQPVEETKEEVKDENPVINPEPVVVPSVDGIVTPKVENKDSETENLFASVNAAIEAAKKMKEENERLKKEINGLSEDKQRLATENESKSQTIKSMETNLASLNTNNQNLSKENKELTEKNKSQETENETLRTENEKLKKQIDETLSKHSQEIAELKSIIEPLKKLATERDQAVESLRKITAAINPEISNQSKSR